MMVRKAILGCVSLAALAGCATTSTNQNASTQATQQMRRRPRRRDVNRMLGDALRRAAECLPRSAPNVTVTGAFHGETGEFRVENIESETPLGTTVRTCVREEFEAARVDPFADPRYEAVRVFSAEGAMLAAQNGAGHTASAAPTTANAASATPDATAADAVNPTAATGVSVSAVNATAPTTSAATIATPVASATPDAGANTNVASGTPTATTTSVTAANTTSNGAASASAAGAANAAATDSALHGAAVASNAGPLPTSVIANCYTSILRVNPSVGGRLRLQFEITPDGSARNVSATAIGTPTGPAALFTNATRCVEQRVRTHAFARTASGHADLVVAMAPGGRGGTIGIQQHTAGLLATAPGLEAVAGDTTPTPTPTPATSSDAGATTQTTTTASTTASWNEVSGTSTYNRQIADNVRARVAEIRACYQGQLARNPDLALRTRVRFTIEPGGHVPTASSTTVVSSGDADAASAVAACVEGVVRATSFPARNGAAAMETSLPFTFSPGPGAAGANASATATATTAPAPVATGRIDPAATSMAIRQHTDQVRACYTRALRANPSLAGRVLVRFIVDPSGRVVSPSSQITPIAGDRAAFSGVAMCIEQVLQAIPLPAPTGGAASVALPFDFTPNTP
jgi:hypothetical protein